MTIIQKIIAWFNGRFQKSQPDLAPKVRRKKLARDHYGSHYYLGDLLQMLDKRFDDLKRFEKLDPESFKAYQKVGASVVSSDFKISCDVQPWFFKKLPSFGCVFTGHNNYDDTGKLGLRFASFCKEKRPVNVQGTNGDIYRCSVMYDMDGEPVGESFFVAVVAGRVIALKNCVPRVHNITAKTKKRGQPPIRRISRMEWRYARFIQEKAEELNTTVDAFAAEIFALIVNATTSRDMGLTVRARKGKMSAAFAIDMLRTPYFFADRDKTVTENGATKKILHIVRGHFRNVKGEQQWVKSHFRGLRKFTWNGYEVSVGLAGKHGSSLSDFNLSAADPMDETANVGIDSVAERLDEIIL